MVLQTEMRPLKRAQTTIAAAAKTRDDGVDVNAVDAIHVLTGVDEPGDGRAGEKDSDEAASDGEQEAFEEAFAKKAHTAGSERGTDSQLFAARGSPGDQQAADV